MGVIFRLARLAAGLLMMTCAAVMYFSTANMEAYADGRGLTGPVDAIIVLGAGADGDGRLAFNSRRRVAPAVALLKSGRASHLIFSGSAEDRVTSVPIGAMMRDYAISLGAPPDQLIVEPRATTTFENLRFSFAIARAQGFDRLAILTDSYHLERAAALAAVLGHPEIQLAAADGLRGDTPANRVWSVLREALAWWYNLAKVASWKALGLAGMSPQDRGEFIR